VGNWERLDARKFPQGLEPLADYVRGKGLKFGLRFDVERAHRNSDLVLQHPEWFFDIGRDLPSPQSGSPVSTGLRDRGRWGMDTETWPGLESLGLQHRPQTLLGCRRPHGKIQFAYRAGLYRVLDTLTREHPHWLVRGCASGVAVSTSARCGVPHTLWFSDHTEDALVFASCKRRPAVLPGNFLNSAVPVGRDTLGHATGSEFPGDAAVLSRMCGALSFNGDVLSGPLR